MIAGLAIGIYKLLKNKGLDDLKVEELQTMAIKLNTKIDELNQETRETEAAIERLFEKARATSTKSEEVSLANRIKTLTKKKEMKQSAVFQLERELRAVNNLLIVKQHERDLKQAGTWEKLKKIKPEKMEEWLTERNLEQQTHREQLDTLTGLTDSAMHTSDYDEDLDDILDVIHDVKKGDMTTQQAKDKLKNTEI